MKKTLIPIVFLFFLLFSVSVNAQSEPIEVEFFFSPGCPHCAKVIGYLENYESEQPGAIEIIKHDVSVDPEYFINLQAEAGIPMDYWGGVPKVFVDDYFCIGSLQCHGELLEKLDKLIEARNETPENFSRWNESITNSTDYITPDKDVNPYQILGLAAVDAVNPCALAVLTLILIAILVQNPEKRHKVLTAGISFTLAIFITYFFYGLVIIQLFKAAVDAISGISLYLYIILGIVAILLGILNIKDFFKYKPGGIGTEMPMRMRGSVKKLTSKATSARGSFIIGILVTLFLLPCTIGPYIITGGILSGLEFMQTIPWLLIYNLIFVFPMLAIVFVVFIGFTTVENVSGWKDKNIRYLHLIAGIIMLILGFVIAFGFV